MPVAKPTIAVDLIAPAGSVSTQAATDTICGYIDDTNTALAAALATQTTNQARMEEIFRLIRQKLMKAGAW